MYADNFGQVGANILRILNEKSMTQQNLADALGISKQVMNKIIKGNKAINVNEITKIADVLNASTDQLLSVDLAPAVCGDLSFMGKVHNQATEDSVNKIKTAIDEIHMLEDLLSE